MTRRRWLLLSLVVLLVLAALALVPRPLSYTPHVQVVGDVDAWVTAKITESQRLGVRPGDEERLVRRAPGKTPVSVLYIHGFGASRAEGEAVVDPIAEEIGANTLYIRLPGHGLDDMDAHAAVTFQQYLDASEEDFQAASALGDRVLLVGCSTGGLLATWLAAQHPDAVAGAILASPLYAFADPTARALLDRPLAGPLLPALYGSVRDAGWKTDPEHRKQEGYEGHWTIHQRYAALLNLAALRRYIVTPETLAAVTEPVLMLDYYKDPEHQDTVVSIDAVHEAYASFGGPRGNNPASGLVDVADGNHILLSAYVRTDKETILGELRAFLRRIGLEPGQAGPSPSAPQTGSQ